MNKFFPLLISLSAAAVDYSTDHHWTSSGLITGLPNQAGDHSFIRKPATISDNELEQLHQYCVDRINMYRSGDLLFSDNTEDATVASGVLQPFEPLKEFYSCSSAQAMGDLKENVIGGGGCAGAHHTAFSCGMQGGRSQNSCCGRGGGSFGRDTSLNTLSLVKAELDSCLQQMWDEGIHPEGQQGHYNTMKSESRTHVSCGFAWTSEGRVMMTQDFTNRAPTCTEPDCSTGAIQWSPSGCSIRSPVSTGCSGTPAPTISPAPTPPPTKAPTPAPTSPTAAPAPTAPFPTDIAMQGSCPAGWFQTCDGYCWPFSILKTLFTFNWNYDRSATCNENSSPAAECCGYTYCGNTGYQSYCNEGRDLYQNFNCSRLNCGNPSCQACSNPVSQGFSKNTQNRELEPFLAPAVTKEDTDEKQSSGISTSYSSFIAYFLLSICLFFL